MEICFKAFPKDFFLNTSLCCLPQSILLQWQPPPAGTHSGQITGYKIRYRKVSRKSDVTESVGGTQLSQLIEGEQDLASQGCLAVFRGSGTGFSGVPVLPGGAWLCSVAQGQDSVGFLPWKTNRSSSQRSSGVVWAAGGAWGLVT